MPEPQRTTIHLKDYAPTPYSIDDIKLDFLIHPERTRVKSRLAVRPNPQSSEAGAPLMLHGEEIELASISLDGRRLTESEYSVTAQTLTLNGVPRVPFAIEIESYCNPSANTALSGLYRSSGVFCTQCEAEGFRRITYAYDRPDCMAKYTVRIEAERESCPVLLSNGNPIETGDVSGTDRHFAVWHDPHPKPSYLFALVAGDLAEVRGEFVTRSGRAVRLGIYVEHGKEDRCAFALQAVKDSMAWDERRFGREYDLDVFNIVAVSDFNMGAMENKGLNVFNDKYILALPETATDTDFVNIEAIIAHEYFHNWTGNRITCRDWFQLCLKEGLTVFRDQEFTSDMRSRPVKRIADVQTLRAKQFPEDAGPLAHPPRPSSYIEINNFYTPTVYEKGAEICRMLRTLLGEAAFKKAMDLYFQRHDGEAATVEQFVQCFADASGRNLTQFFTWYEQAGTPVVTASTAHDPTTATYTITLSQATAPTPGQADKKPQHMPIGIGLVDKNGNDLPLMLEGHGALNEPLIELSEATQTFRFTGISERPALSLNRGFSAPVIIRSDQTAGDRLFLMGHDSDAFNRWEAGQSEALNLLTDSVKAIACGGKAPSTSNFTAALGQSLNDRKLDDAFKAQMLSLPTEAAICAAIGTDIDTDIVFAARQQVRRDIGMHLGKGFRAHLNSTHDEESYSPSAAASGRRSLRYTCLAYLASGFPEEGEKLAMAEFKSARHMTAEIGALTAMLALPASVAEAALSLFYDKHKDDHLLVDKWFGLMAAIPGPDAPARIARLLQHPDFKLTTPNRVYALIGGFTAANVSGFNAANGSGYRLVADTIIQLDPVNPQVAARMTTSFRSWRLMNEARRLSVRDNLRRIVAQPNLSADTFEIASKTLGTSV